MYDKHKINDNFEYFSAAVISSNSTISTDFYKTKDISKINKKILT